MKDQAAPREAAARQGGYRLRDFVVGDVSGGGQQAHPPIIGAGHGDDFCAVPAVTKSAGATLQISDPTSGLPAAAQNSKTSG